ncbi:LysR family transcriptional regulator [Novosphingobium sp. FSW06-99]|uniref:LysR family transcriptional regulator n=1 Tax=Novosphingobium sp. FSW06-99 TaxID=1739113 RepID=UPI00076CB6AB|nr:LysR family transcriptional regulator [Novosphingobium sp. FSW06-99]KUR78260.1 LysR family transcriptional regulator [Novosphingobium sp. FSW06-99]
MDRFEAMEMLLAAVDRGSLSAAARHLRVPVPTLSRKVADLEALLGTRLLIRTTRKLSLTDAGLAYVTAARRIIEQVQEAEREAAGEFIVPRGDLIITAPETFGRRHVLPIVMDFLALFPQINVRLELANRNANLFDDHIDMAVRIGRLPDSSMIATRIGTMRALTCASPAVIAGHGVPQHPRDLETLPCIALDGATAASAWRFRDPETGTLMEADLPARLITGAEARVEAAIAGAGFARLLHYQAWDALCDGRLVTVLDAYEPDPLPVHLIHVTRGQMPLKMRRFLDFAAPRLRQVIAQFTREPAG